MIKNSRKLNEKYSPSIQKKKNNESISCKSNTSILNREKDLYLKIEEIPSLVPEKEDIKNPLNLVRKLMNTNVINYGAIKLKIPEEYQVELPLSQTEKLIYSRKQTLQNLMKGEPFIRNKEGCTPLTFMGMAEYQSDIYEYQNKQNFDCNLNKKEYEFWYLIENPDSTKICQTEYVSDLNSDRYINFNSRKLQEEKYANNNLLLHKINSSKNSLFQFLRKKQYIQGITSPWIYIGMLFSCFCWHVEDNYMFSASHMYEGTVKTWYIVPGSHKREIDSLLNKKFKHLIKNDPSILYSLNLMLNPLDFIEANIPIYKCNQYPGETVIIFPQAYHSGFSNGYTLNEAVNFGITEWLYHNRQANIDYKINGNIKKELFPHEWIVVENLLNINYIKIDLISKNMV